MSNDLEFISVNGVNYIVFKRLLEYGVINAYTLKGLNFNSYKGKYDTSVFDNYKKLFECLGLDINYFVKGKQIHSDIINVIDGNTDIMSLVGDALITNMNGYSLCTINADCILMVFYDVKNKVIANVHSGWRGTLKRVGIKTLEVMNNKYNTQYRDVICCISPSIRKCHFEVDYDVYKMFLCEFSDIDINKYIEKKDNCKWYIDTVGIYKEFFINMGILSYNIIDSSICSVCDDNVYSYRCEGLSCGEGTFVICMK